MTWSHDPERSSSTGGGDPTSFDISGFESEHTWALYCTTVEKDGVGRVGDDPFAYGFTVIRTRDGFVWAEPPAPGVARLQRYRRESGGS